MYVRIHAVNAETDIGYEEFPEGGKRTILKSSDYRIEGSRDGVVIRAKCSQDRGSGARGGRTVTIDRRLMLTLDPGDLAKVFCVVYRNKILPPPAELSEAQEHIRQALALLQSASNEGCRK
jgi:hypothetical protein